MSEYGTMYAKLPAIRSEEPDAAKDLADIDTQISAFNAEHYVPGQDPPSNPQLTKLRAAASARLERLRSTRKHIEEAAVLEVRDTIDKQRAAKFEELQAAYPLVDQAVEHAKACWQNYVASEEAVRAANARVVSLNNELLYIQANLERFTQANAAVISANAAKAK